MSGLTLEKSRERRITVVQGSCHVSADPDVLMSAVLGSCVACCLYDPRARVGGMNHFLLAEPRGGAVRGRGDAERYGLYAMELLVNEMLKAGASRGRLRAHLYGGANLHAGMHMIGTDNAAFARRFLIADNIPLVHSHLGGTKARRVDFRPVQGQARCRVVADDVGFELRRPVPLPESGDVELF